MGDVGRRGHLQNLPCGPTATCPGPTVPDDQFGGPEPDDEHLHRRRSPPQRRRHDPDRQPVLRRRRDDAAARSGANVRKIFSYGHRNGFGMAVDPQSGDVWLQENGDDSFSELNRLEPGQNGGWVQIAGPVSRIAQFKEIETTFGGQNLQQLRWPPENIADTPAEALARLFALPGSHYSDPEFSWKWEVAPGGIGFQDGRALGPQYDGDLFMGAATPILEGGYLFRFNLTGNRRKVGVDDPRLARPGRRQPGQARDHRERVAARGPQLRRRHRHRDGAERQPVRRVADGRRGVRDLPPLAEARRARGRAAAGPRASRRPSEPRCPAPVPGTVVRSPLGAALHASPVRTAVPGTCAWHRFVLSRLGAAHSSRMRGSIQAYRRSTTRLKKMMATVEKTTTPWTIGRS